jgi:hypothetical protein
MPILAIMALCAVLSLVWATADGRSSWERTWFMIVPFGLYAGWTVCATFVNIAEVGPGYGFDRFGLSVPGYAVLSIAVLTLVVAGVLWLTAGNLAFAGAVGWALIAIIAAAWSAPVDNSVPIAAGAALLSVIALTAVLRLRGPGFGA